MVMVKNGLHHGFRRKGSSEGNRTGYSRGEKESLTHQGNKEVIASMEELIIKTNEETIRLFIESAECEKAVICRGKRYEIDIYIKLRKTEPMEYYHKWNGELWFEVFHTCPVDYSLVINDWKSCWMLRLLGVFYEGDEKSDWFLQCI